MVSAMVLGGFRRLTLLYVLYATGKALIRAHSLWLTSLPSALTKAEPSLCLALLEYGEAALENCYPFWLMVTKQ